MAEPHRHFMKDLEAAGLTYNESLALAICLDYVQDQLKKGAGTFAIQYGTRLTEMVTALRLETE